MRHLLYINQGDGTSRRCHAYGLDVEDSSVMAGPFCDYDSDGFLDLYLTTNMLGTTT